MPVLLREDPRYFLRGTCSVKGRILYAATRVLIAKTDKGIACTFNASEFLGNAVLPQPLEMVHTIRMRLA